MVCYQFLVIDRKMRDARAVLPPEVERFWLAARILWILATSRESLALSNDPETLAVFICRHGRLDPEPCCIHQKIDRSFHSGSNDPQKYS